MSKRPAVSPFASPSKPAASAKRSRTQYDYYDEEDAESYPEVQWSDDDMDSPSRMSWDDSDDIIENLMPDSGSPPASASSNDDVFSRMKYVKTRKVTEEKNQVPGSPDPPPASSTSCRCGAANARRKACVGCACSKWGYRCRPDLCGCHGGASCHNPFNHVDLPALFGPAPVVLHGCFVGWVRRRGGQKRHAAAAASRTPAGGGDERPLGLDPRHLVTAQHLFDLALAGAEAEGGFGCLDGDADERYRAWRARWDVLPADERRDGGSARGLALQQELNRMAFTRGDWPEHEVFYSFCRPWPHWESTEHTSHCDVCGECMDWREWHRGTCNKCVYGVSLACEGCGGVSDTYHDFVEDMGMST